MICFSTQQKNERQTNMKGSPLFSLASLVSSVAWLSACMNREPAPLACPAPLQSTEIHLRCGGYDGVDWMFVIDNSQSMAEEQKNLGTQFFAMMNAFLQSTRESGNVSDMRVAVVTSDLGLQYGGNPGPTDVVDRVAGCDAMGDDGAFQAYAAGQTVWIQDNFINCKPGWAQCPNEQWQCVDGKCAAPISGQELSCPPLTALYAETTPPDLNKQLTLQAACMAQQGTAGCGIAQPLEASLAALKKNPSFVRYHNVLAVVIVSDNDDCSIKDKSLFSTPQWHSGIETGSALNTACHTPSSNEENYLYEVVRYKEELDAIKGWPGGVVFAAIVGVPADNYLCQGSGNQIGEACLQSEEMTLDIQEFDDEGRPSGHIQPACVRYEDGAPNSKILTEARPGRRYVQLAREFGDRGYVFSICNPDWSPLLMDAVPRLLVAEHCGACYTEPIAWDPVQRVADCEVLIDFSYPEPDQNCPEPLVTAWIEQNKGKGQKDYDAMVRRERIYDKAKKFVSETVQCPLAKIPVDLSCAQAVEELGPDIARKMGWYYCEDYRNNSDCRTVVTLTNEARYAAGGRAIWVQCSQPSSSKNAKCQEATVDACWNGIDDDGNIAFDCCQNRPDVAPTSEVCDIDQGTNYHLADPNCCPMTVSEDYLCEPDISICGGGPGNWPDACLEAARRLGCRLSR
jgi:hypothetical protein